MTAWAETTPLQCDRRIWLTLIQPRGHGVGQSVSKPCFRMVSLSWLCNDWAESLRFRGRRRSGRRKMIRGGRKPPANNSISHSGVPKRGGDAVCLAIRDPSQSERDVAIVLSRLIFSELAEPNHHIPTWECSVLHGLPVFPSSSFESVSWSIRRTTIYGVPLSC